MIGVASLGGAIYQMAIAIDTDFIIIVWLTGIIKIIGGLILGIMLRSYFLDARWNIIYHFK